ncbi:hypothetical protein [Virgisporangium ochraceum]|uniref:Uncharacterized protein n=1 Tax=Virgisporangium ochraceum TaxID=65505 RepID=A0A8J4A0F4_9ACTN|nr:hypothetical protein [Virgisporangium ochraceum]GIJ73579.1 hypothetical protein Voc01_084960 [Virgisporangium ochraceum]
MIFRIELRRSSAVWSALLALSLGVAVLVSFPQGFAGRWIQLASAGRTMLLVLVPLALAGGAWLGRREARSRVGELFATTARPRWRRVLPTAAALGVTMASAYVLMLVIGAGWVAPTARHVTVGAVGLAAAGAVSMVTAAWLGLAAGRAMPWLVTPPALAVVGVLVAGLLPDFVSVNSVLSQDRLPPAALMLSPVYVGGLDDFQTFPVRHSLVQAGWFVAVAVTGLLLYGATRPLTRGLAVLPAALGLAVTLPLLPAGAYEGAARPDPVALELVCDDAGPQVCMTRVHANLLSEVAGPVREALAVLAAKLPDAPTRAVESGHPRSFVRQGLMSDPPRYGADTLVFTAPSYGRTGGADLSGDWYLRTLLAEVWRLDCGDQPYGKEVYLAGEVAASWLVGRAVGYDPETPAAYERFLGLPAQEQRARLAAARADVVACRTDALVAVLR